MLLLLLLLLMMMPKGDWHPPSAAGQAPPPKVKVGFDAHAELLCAFAQLFHRAIMGKAVKKSQKSKKGKKGKGSDRGERAERRAESQQPCPPRFYCFCCMLLSCLSSSLQPQTKEEGVQQNVRFEGQVSLCATSQT